MPETLAKTASVNAPVISSTVAPKKAQPFEWRHPWVIKPAVKLLWIVSGWASLAALLLLLRLLHSEALMEWIEPLRWIWWAAGGGLVFWCAGDIWQQSQNQQLFMARLVPDSLSVGVPQSVTLVLKYSGGLPVRIWVYDHFCSKLSAQDALPFSLELKPAQRVSLSYKVLPKTRGDAVFSGCEIWVHSPSGLWQRRYWFEVRTDVRVYPNFAAVAKAESIGLEFHLTRMGVHVQQRRGQGVDFKQLRAFQVGDTLRQVDWKATSRRRKTIVREYQDERGQDVIFLLDCGRSMRAKEEGLSHFDAALNALLLSAYTALRQGDRVGLQAFAGQSLWQPPQAGSGAVNTLLHCIYDLQSTTASQDYLLAAKTLLTNHRKRSVILMMTNLRTALSDNLLAACRLLSQRHVVCVISLKEESMAQVIQEPVNSLEEAVSVSAALSLASERERRLKLLRHQGVLAVEAFPAQLHHEVVRQYQSLKKSGRA